MTEVPGGPIGLRDDEPLPKTGEGVAAPAAKDPTAPAEGNEQTFSQSQVDELKASWTEETRAEIQAETEKQIGNVRSDLMKAQAQERKDWQRRDSQHEKLVHDLTVRDMDENQRNAFEAKLYAERNLELSQRLAQTEEDLAAANQMGSYMQGLATSFGVDLKDLDASDLDRLSETAWDAAANKHKQVLQELETARQELEVARTGKPVEDGGEPQKPPLPKAPEVVTDVGETPKGVPTILDMRKSISQKLGLDTLISEDYLFELAENPEDSGVDLNVLLPAIQAEIDATGK